MVYLALFLLIICFFKTFYYGVYEFKEKQNKSGGISVCLLALLRTYLSKYYPFYVLHLLIKTKPYWIILISAYFLGSNSSLYSTSSNNAGICFLKYNNNGIINCWMDG